MFSKTTANLATVKRPGCETTCYICTDPNVAGFAATSCGEIRTNSARHDENLQRDSKHKHDKLMLFLKLLEMPLL